jgi:hypothetical protein
MIDVQDTHRQAMEKADQADAAKKGGDLEKARTLLLEACRLESEAAHALVDQPDAEPTRSVLFRSAASLAVEARQFAYAAYLIACGLEAFPPQEIREELRALLRTVRHEVERDRVGRFLSSCSVLQDAADRVRTALADSGLVGRALSGAATHGILDATQHALRAFSGDAGVQVDLFHFGDTELVEWVSVCPIERLSESWFPFAKIFVFDNEDKLLRAKPIVQQLNELGTAAREAGIGAVAAYPVRAIKKRQAERPALVLLAFASQEMAFADELARQILSDAVSLLEIVIRIGWRDEVFELDTEAHEEGS